MPQYRVLIASFPYSSPNCIDLANWVTQTVISCREDKRIGPGNVSTWHVADTPITMGRNRAVKVAQDAGYDYLVMVDDDMVPDLPYEGAKPFWPSTFDFMVNHPGPCAVAAPYNGPPPEENCYVFRWANRESGHPNADFQIEAYRRAECENMRGIQPCAAFPTGICVFDVRAFDVLRKAKMSNEQILEGFKAGALTKDAAIRQLKMQTGHFYYEWTDDGQTEKASTEDVTLSRDLGYVGVPIYCNWDAYAGHRKIKTVGRPGAIPAHVVPEMIRQRAMELAREEFGIDVPPKSMIRAETPMLPANRIESFGPCSTAAVDNAPRPELAAALRK